jgi:hypothetical protein
MQKLDEQNSESESNAVLKKLESGELRQHQTTGKQKEATDPPQAEELNLELSV